MSLVGDIKLQIKVDKSGDKGGIFQLKADVDEQLLMTVAAGWYTIIFKASFSFLRVFISSLTASVSVRITLKYKMHSLKTHRSSNKPFNSRQLLYFIYFWLFEWRQQLKRSCQPVHRSNSAKEQGHHIYIYIYTFNRHLLIAFRLAVISRQWGEKCKVVFVFGNIRLKTVCSHIYIKVCCGWWIWHYSFPPDIPLFWLHMSHSRYRM